MHNPSLSPPTPNQYWPVFSMSIFLHGPWLCSTHSVTISLRNFKITQAAALISHVCSSKKYILNYYRLCHANSLNYINK
jgi:hypothetical protein